MLTNLGQKSHTNYICENATLIRHIKVNMIDI